MECSFACLKDVFRFTDYYSTRYRIFLYTVYQVAGTVNTWYIYIPAFYHRNYMTWEGYQNHCAAQLWLLRPGRPPSCQRQLV